MRLHNHIDISRTLVHDNLMTHLTCRLIQVHVTTLPGCPISYTSTTHMYMYASIEERILLLIIIFIEIGYIILISETNKYMCNP